MRIDHSLTFLKQMLAAAGFESDRPDPMRVWAAFKAFLFEPITDCDHNDPDTLLVEWGVDEQSQTLFLNFIRRCPVSVNGDYSHTVETRCDLSCPYIGEEGPIVSYVGPHSRATLYKKLFDIERHESFCRILRHDGQWTAEVYQQQQ
jgi:hypothetical protein